MKLKLEKQKVTTLSSDDMSSVNGGGEARSDRKLGDCRYSRRNSYSLDENKKIDGCAVGDSGYPYHLEAGSGQVFAGGGQTPTDTVSSSNSFSTSFAIS